MTGRSARVGGPPRPEARGAGRPPAPETADERSWAAVAGRPRVAGSGSRTTVGATRGLAASRAVGRRERAGTPRRMCRAAKIRRTVALTAGSRRPATPDPVTADGHPHAVVRGAGSESRPHVGTGPGTVRQPCPTVLAVRALGSPGRAISAQPPWSRPRSGPDTGALRSRDPAPSVAAPARLPYLRSRARSAVTGPPPMRAPRYRPWA